MRGEIIAFIAGVGSAIGIGAIYSRRRLVSRFTSIDLNGASADSFLKLGLDPDSVDRVIENRPYRSKLELLERFVLPKADYDLIKLRIYTDPSHANDGVRVAS